MMQFHCTKCHKTEQREAEDTETTTYTDGLCADCLEGAELNLNPKEE